MKSIYHYTKIDSFKQIVKNGDLNFRASRYSNFGNQDYVWIIEPAKGVIKEMCESTKQTHEDDHPEFRPYIISFCKNGSSKYMWEHYAGYEGVLLELNREIVRKTTFEKKNPAHFLECIYVLDEIKRDSGKLGKILVKAFNSLELQSDSLQSDLLECTCLLKQEKYREEREIRYIILNYDKIRMSNTNGILHVQNGVENEDNVETIQEKKYMYRIFPQETLLGVTFGPEVRDDVIKEVYYLLKDKGFKLSKESFKRLKRVSTRNGPKLWKYKCDSLFKRKQLNINK